MKKKICFVTGTRAEYGLLQILMKKFIKDKAFDSKILVTNLLGDIENIEEFEDRNCIKVVCDQQSNAIYFSREPIPTRSEISNIPMKKQICIIPFKRKFLLEYTKLPPTPLEIAESIDMNRVLEHGMKVKMVPTKHKTYAVDTKEDLNKVEKLKKKLNDRII